MVPACLMWLIWRERNTCTFEDVEKFVDFLKSLLVGTLVGWSRIWGFTQCISIFDFLHSVFVSLWFFCICFKYNLFIIVNMIYFFIDEISITYPKKKKHLNSQMQFVALSHQPFSSTKHQPLLPFLPIGGWRRNKEWLQRIVEITNFDEAKILITKWTLKINL